MLVPATGIFLNPLSGPLVIREGLCRVEFQGALEDARYWFAHAWRRVFAPAAVLASEVGHTGK